MRTIFFAIIFMITFTVAKSQTVKDFFNNKDIKVTWLGIDYSHVKLMGSFAQFDTAGEKDYDEIKTKYFPAWNKLVLNEPQKYDVKGMISRSTISYDIEMINEINEKTNSDKLRGTEHPNYSLEDIKSFVSNYNIKNKEGLGFLFIAEVLDKIEKKGYYRFVVINMKTKEVFVNELVKGAVGGIGIRNYWARSIYESIKEVKYKYNERWQKKYLNN